MTGNIFKRRKVKNLFEKILNDEATKLSPVSFSASEIFLDDFTTVDFSFREQTGSTSRVVTVDNLKARGFVDGLFKGCFNTYKETYPSLSNIKLVDVIVNPLFRSGSRGLGSESKINVTFRVEIHNHGIVEFETTSNSIMHSSFSATLEAFQFYINCERTFQKMKLIMDDAKARNRSDIFQRCLFDLSALTEMNSYEK